MTDTDQATSRATVALPKLKHLGLDNFSLFQRRPDVQVSLNDGVTCLVGANGIGKSTFIAAVNYALTGRVPEPGRGFSSADEYCDKIRTFTTAYFDGRLSEEHRLDAVVSITFSVASTEFSLRRGFFEPDELRYLRISDGERVYYEGNVDEISGGELHENYERELCRAVGLQRFSQFVFLQLFLLTFDERRHLNFWDPNAIQQLLFLIFGMDPQAAASAETFFRTFQRQDSLARNYQWQATDARKRLREAERALAAVATDELDDALVREHRDLLDREGELRQLADTKEAELSEHRLQASEAAAQFITLQDQYERAFDARAKGHAPVRHHPVIAASLTDRRCAVCGTSGNEVVAQLEQAITSHKCPLCDSNVTAPGVRSTTDLDELKRIDRELAGARSRINNEMAATRRLEEEISTARASHSEITRALQEFERDNEMAARTLTRETDTAASAVAVFRAQIDRMLEQKRVALEKREVAREQLTKLQRAVRKQYDAVEEEFVPRFRQLAESFLGLDLDLKFENRGGGIGLKLIVGGSARLEHHQLSESQRFFVDIALRMALTGFASESSGATMLIDTPEGALDVAYESRAGEMFAEFTRGTNRLLMTANVNTSQLLLRLAERCGHLRMQVIRMTDWANLSDVQIAEESEFDRAFAEIENSLAKGDGPP
jgi:hypothetical protein